MGRHGAANASDLRSGERTRRLRHIDHYPSSTPRDLLKRGIDALVAYTSLWASHVGVLRVESAAMATANYELATELQASIPHTFNAMQHLVMAMAVFQKSRSKKSFFGRGKGLIAYKKFEDKPRDTFLAMALDELIERDAAPAACRGMLNRSHHRVFSGLPELAGRIRLRRRISCRRSGGCRG